MESVKITIGAFQKLYHTWEEREGGALKLSFLTLGVMGKNGGEGIENMEQMCI